MTYFVRIANGNLVDQAIVAEQSFVDNLSGNWVDVTGLDPQPGIGFRYNPGQRTFDDEREIPVPPPKSPDELRIEALKNALQQVLDSPAAVEASNALLRQIIELQIKSS